MKNYSKACIFNIQRFSIHDGPGIRTTVFFKGCPLHCPWCANPESQNFTPERMWDNNAKDYITTGSYMTTEEIVETVLKDIDYYKESGGGVTLSGGEVLSQVQAAVALIKACKRENLHVACETSVFASDNTFNLILSQLDLLIVDIKHYDPQKHTKYVGGSLDVILKNIRHAVTSGIDMLVRIPVIPGFNDSLEDAKVFSKLLHELHISKVELLPFHQFGKSKYKFLERSYDYKDVKQLHGEDLEAYKEILEHSNIACHIS